MSIKWLVKLMTELVWTRNNGRKIERYIASKQIKWSSNLDSIDRRGIRVCAVQQEIRILKNYRQYVDRMCKFIEKGVEEGAQLIVFPEENGTLILGMLPFAETILKKMTGGEMEEDIGPKEEPDTSNGFNLDVTEILSILTPFLIDVFETTFSKLALNFGVYIMAGSIMIEDQGSIYNRSYLFAPDGRIVGKQDKLHLVVFEMDMGLSTGDELSVFETPIGNIAFPVCMDATYFETFKIAKDKGAEIVIIPIANMEEYNYYFALRGIWPRVQESGVYGIKSALVGKLYGLTFTGKAGIYAPLVLTPNGDGILKESQSYDKDEVVVCDIDLHLMENYSDPYFSDENRKFLKRYYPFIYEAITVYK